MDGKPNRRKKKTAFSNFSGVVRMGLKESHVLTDGYTMVGILSNETHHSEFSSIRIKVSINIEIGYFPLNLNMESA